ncbi:MAG: type II toxin-antitoxin system VapC family toxin [Rhodospirillales bacterium]|nr:type II toxin-antitoxin system VapC family toxin [Rhodospirillales bacterium]
MNFVLDASLALAWCFEEEDGRKAEHLLVRLTEGSAKALVPSLWPLEIANALRMAEKRRVVKPEDTAAYLGLFAALPITVSERTLAPKPLLDLARQYDLTAYDAAYLDLAQCMALPLATLDNKLEAAAKAAKLPELR